MYERFGNGNTGYTSTDAKVPSCPLASAFIPAFPSHSARVVSLMRMVVLAMRSATALAPVGGPSDLRQGQTASALFAGDCHTNGLA